MMRWVGLVMVIVTVAGCGQSADEARAREFRAAAAQAQREFDAARAAKARAEAAQQALEVQVADIRSRLANLAKQMDEANLALAAAPSSAERDAIIARQQDLRRQQAAIQDEIDRLRRKAKPR